MITALIRAGHEVEALAVTLSALVPGVVDGLVSDAIVLARQPDEALARVTDTMGAALLGITGDPFREGAGHAKRDWLLCLASGDVPGEGWVGALERFITLSPPDRRFGRLGRPGASWRQRVLALRPGRAIRPGDLVHRSVLLGARRLPRPARVSVPVVRDPVFG